MVRRSPPEAKIAGSSPVLDVFLQIAKSSSQALESLLAPRYSMSRYNSNGFTKIRQNFYRMKARSFWNQMLVLAALLGISRAASAHDLDGAQHLTWHGAIKSKIRNLLEHACDHAAQLAWHHCKFEAFKVVAQDFECKENPELCNNAVSIASENLQSSMHYASLRNKDMCESDQFHFGELFRQVLAYSNAIDACVACFQTPNPNGPPAGPAAELDSIESRPTAADSDPMCTLRRQFSQIERRINTMLHKSMACIIQHSQEPDFPLEQLDAHIQGIIHTHGCTKHLLGIYASLHKRYTHHYSVCSNLFVVLENLAWRDFSPTAVPLSTDLIAVQENIERYSAAPHLGEEAFVQSLHTQLAKCAAELLRLEALDLSGEGTF
ncbi:hypothetical protein PAPHI01_1681 [Pancytospora philotis]|nr:hypothetical protein PAPHI01_1681 [Pancytospora philotis]